MKDNDFEKYFIRLSSFMTFMLMNHLSYPDKGINEISKISDKDMADTFGPFWNTNMEDE